MKLWSSYSSVQFDNKRLRKQAAALARKIPELMRELDADTIVVTGKSGISLAFATLMLIDFPLVVVRKPGENAHGDTVEGRDNTLMHRYIILDDFVASGETVRRIINTVWEHASGCVGLEPVCAGVLQYKDGGYPDNDYVWIAEAPGNDVGVRTFNAEFC